MMKMITVFSFVLVSCSHLTDVKIVKSQSEIEKNAIKKKFKGKWTCLSKSCVPGNTLVIDDSVLLFQNEKSLSFKIVKSEKSLQWLKIVSIQSCVESCPPKYYQIKIELPDEYDSHKELIKVSSGENMSGAVSSSYYYRN